MIGRTVSHYEISEKLGGGGMGVVYRARDTRLDRWVALKFLPESVIEDREATRRFEMEARAASSLNHPNICTIHEIDRHGERPFIVMEYLEGMTLKRRLEGSRLSTAEIVRITTEIADALHAAHENGIIHRDIKPANIFITSDGRTKVLDFGLAKLVNQPLRSPLGEGATLEGPATEPGRLMGTLAYMSPEQIRGETLDVRSDLFSLGVVLYEMATGKRPFDGVTSGALISEILSKAPEAPHRLNPGLPPDLERVLGKLLEKDRALRCPGTADLLVDLRRLRQQVSRSGSAVAGWAEEGGVIRRSGSGARLRIGFWALLVLVLFFIVADWESGWLRQWMGRGVSGKHIAVLPFSNVGDHPERQAICDGLVESLTSLLTRMERFQGSLWVVPATEVRSRKITSAREARDAFGVNLVVTGSLWFQDETSLKLTLNVVDAAHLRQLRSEVLTTPVNRLDELQRQTLTHLAGMIEMELPPDHLRVLAAGFSPVAEAYSLYLQARGYLLRSDQLESIDRAIQLLEEALHEDPGYGLAAAALGEACWLKWRHTTDPSWIKRAIEQSEEALKINPDLPEVHVSLGNIYLETSRYGEAIQSFERALEIDPAHLAARLGLASTHEAMGEEETAERIYLSAVEIRPSYWDTYNRLGAFYIGRGRYREAVEPYRQVIRLIPDSPWGYNNLGGVSLFLNDIEEAEKWFRRSIEVEPNYSALSNLATIRFNQRDFAGAAELYEKAVALNDRDYLAWGNLGAALRWIPDRQDNADEAFGRAAGIAEEVLEIRPGNPEVLSDLAVYHAELGREQAAHEFIERATYSGPDNLTVMANVASAHLVLGEVGQALDWLERALEGGYTMELVEGSPGWDELRETERYQALKKKFLEKGEEQE